MKYVKTFESFKVNEEISLRELSPIIASLFFAFNSFDASAYGGARRHSMQTTKEIQSISDKIERDLERLKSETSDPKLLDLIESVQSLDGWKYEDGMEQVEYVVKKMNDYIISEKIDASLIGDSLNNLPSGDVGIIEADYKQLLQKYEEIDSYNEDMRLILMVVCALTLSFLVLLGLRYKNLRKSF